MRTIRSHRRRIWCSVNALGAGVDSCLGGLALPFTRFVGASDFGGSGVVNSLIGFMVNSLVRITRTILFTREPGRDEPQDALSGFAVSWIGERPRSHLAQLLQYIGGREQRSPLCALVVRDGI